MVFLERVRRSRLRTCRPSPLALLAFLALLTILARPSLAAAADPPPILIDYHAAPGCPGEDVFLDEILWRSSVVRLASPWERDVLLVEARLTQRGALHSGRLSLGRGRDRTTREIQGESCDEVVSALALVTALAVDPRASMARKRPSPSPSSSPAPAPASGALAAAPPGRSSPFAALPLLVPPELLATPLPALLSAQRAVPVPVPVHWFAGARFSTAFAVTPRPLFGGGLFAERAIGLFAWLRAGIDLAATGTFTAGPGDVWFLHAAGRVEGCAFRLRLYAKLSVIPCLGLEGGALHGEGVVAGSITKVSHLTVPWAAAGALPRFAIDLGAAVLELQGGPTLPLVRRSFTFENPNYVIHDLPAVTLGLTLGARVPLP